MAFSRFSLLFISSRNDCDTTRNLKSSSRSPQLSQRRKRDGMPLSSAAGGARVDARFERAHELAQRVAQHKENERKRGIKLDRALLARADDVGGGEYVGHADHAGDGRILKGNDALGA